MATRNTQRQQNILEVLSSDAYAEVGTQPYTAPTVAYLLHFMGLEPVQPRTTTVRATLKRMAAKGLVTVVKVDAEVHTGLGCITRPLDAYWNAETMAADAIRAQAWNDGASQRQEAALSAFFAKRTDAKGLSHE